ncbi:MAG: GNAT family N-acetyltransferase [Actinobacteria bacterium]|nr:GNAT family N-acetyltransferase [Actinomycetota bacterium]
MDGIEVRAPTMVELPAVHRRVIAAWGAPIMVVHGVGYDLTALPVIVAMHRGHLVGAVTYRIDAGRMELASMNAFQPRRGIGTALLGAVVRTARHRGADLVWCTTTNDNLDALRFYQRRGFRLVGIRPGAVDQSRRRRPEIPTVGAYGIAIRDELDLALELRSP